VRADVTFTKPDPDSAANRYTEPDSNGPSTDSHRHGDRDSFTRVNRMRPTPHPELR
jgi:hypothetical protein